MTSFINFQLISQNLFKKLSFSNYLKLGSMIENLFGIIFKTFKNVERMDGKGISSY
jgi:hypothetical protein